MPTDRIRMTLKPRGDQVARLEALQKAFAQACNAIVPIASSNRCWNRVALHHLSYRMLRERFPELGSQMACNAIYSVARSLRLLFQHPASPLHLSRLPAGMIPLVQFAERCPVYFDRHTFSLKDGRVSMFTMDGRMRFQGNFGANEQGLFLSQERKLREVVLLRSLRGEFSLHFHFQDINAPSDPLDWPTYVLVDVLAGKLNDNDPQAVIHGGEGEAEPIHEAAVQSDNGRPHNTTPQHHTTSQDAAAPEASEVSA